MKSQTEHECESDIESGNAIVLNCIACQNGDAPSGAHKCVKCSKFVHILDGCSISCGNDEGYGEGRICVACSQIPKEVQKKAPIETITPATSSTSTAKLLNKKEKWSTSMPKSSRSYLLPVPNWNLDKQVQSRARIHMFANGSLSTTTHKVGKATVSVTNTCAFDSICQVSKIIRFYH